MTVKNNKVVLSNGAVIIDISDSTVDRSDISYGKWAYNAAGEKISGTAADNYLAYEGSCPATFDTALPGDFVSLTQFGMCAQSVTPTPDNPVDIICNNGALALSPISRNLFDGDYTLGGTITASGGDGSTNAARLRLGYTLLSAGTYTLSTTGVCDQAVVWAYSGTTGSGGTKLSPGTDFESLPATFTLSESKYVRAMCRNSQNPTLNEEYAGRFQIEAGESATEYTDPQKVRGSGVAEELTIGTQTASVADLLGTDKAIDEQEIISGTVTRRVGVYIVTGEEDLTLAYSGCVYFTKTGVVPNLSGLSNASFSGMCTHFDYNSGRQTSQIDDLQFIANGTGTPIRKNGRLTFRYDDVFTTAEAAQEWFAQQLENGTPVIVVYTMRLPVIEAVEGQHIGPTDTDKTIQMTSELSDIQLTATYGAAPETNQET